MRNEMHIGKDLSYNFGDIVFNMHHMVDSVLIGKFNACSVLIGQEG